MQPNRRPPSLRGEPYVLFRSGIDHVGLRHFLLDASKCCFAKLFLNSILRHVPTMVSTSKLLIVEQRGETGLPPSSGVPGICRQDFLLLHQIKCRICPAQELLNRISVLGIDGDTHADGEPWSVGVTGDALADAPGYLVGFPCVRLR